MLPAFVGICCGRQECLLLARSLRCVCVAFARRLRGVCERKIARDCARLREIARRLRGVCAAFARDCARLREIARRLREKDCARLRGVCERNIARDCARLREIARDCERLREEDCARLREQDSCWMLLGCSSSNRNPNSQITTHPHSAQQGVAYHCACLSQSCCRGTRLVHLLSAPARRRTARRAASMRAAFLPRWPTRRAAVQTRA